MLTAADLAGAPRFENGVWLMSDQISSEPCPVDTIKPVQPPDTAPDPLPNFFLAFDQKPVAGERLSAVDLWLVMCGKFSARERRGEEEAGKEFFTYPGFDKQCRPNSIDAFRAAAAASRTPERQRLQIRWVRAVLD